MKALTIYPQGPQAENSFLPLIQGCWALCWGLCTDYHNKIITENLFSLDPIKTSEAQSSTSNVISTNLSILSMSKVIFL